MKYPKDFLEKYIESKGNSELLQNKYNCSKRSIRYYVSSLINDLQKDNKEIVYYRDNNGSTYPVRCENIKVNDNNKKINNKNIYFKDNILNVYGNAIIAGDFHIPQHDNVLIDKIINKSKEENIKTLIINGDFLNMDQFASFTHKIQTKWEEEKKGAKKILKKLCNVFNTIVIIPGNHDDRFYRNFKFVTNFEDLISIIKPNNHKNKIFITNKDYCVLNDSWHISHSEEYSKNQGRKSIDFALKYEMNIINGHTHHLSKNILMKYNHYNDKKELFKSFICMDGGCIVDPKKVDYINNKTTSFPEWSQGFIIIKDNEPIIITDNIGKLMKVNYCFNEIIEKLVY